MQVVMFVSCCTKHCEIHTQTEKIVRSHFQMEKICANHSGVIQPVLTMMFKLSEFNFKIKSSHAKYSCQI